MGLDGIVNDVLASADEIPVIDVAPLVQQNADPGGVAREIAAACQEHGFFYIVGHGVSEELIQYLEKASRKFFALPLATKMRIAMEQGGRAWRGYFPIGDELTSGRPDLKEGLYFGRELAADHPLVHAGTPLHGPNLFPAEPVELGDLVLAYMNAMTSLSHALMRGLALSLGLYDSYFDDRYTRDPLILFRIFHYPHCSPSDGVPNWGVGEHTDYGVLTILRQDDNGGLQIKSRRRPSADERERWINAPPIPGSFVCNIGDMLERMTAGLYRSTPHRVRNTSGHGRLSFPFFFDPNFAAKVSRIDGISAPADAHEPRWDHADVHAFDGTYGDYLLAKVGKVFPELRRRTL